ncbi:MAG TPA: regulatory iron-sulfur-containing complex subunit RicT [Gemmatimonadaceae bacterium]|nr:regulatory iron-sulfur-containing complex subunit RicT [Gemmatimonadaceae bacterium]
MAHLIEVAFKGNRREFFLWNAEEPPALRSHVIVEADRGEDLGRVHAIGDLAQLRARGCTHGTRGEEPTLKALRAATQDEVRRLTELREQDDAARRDASGLVTTHSLPMKLTDTEWRWDRRKLTLYFTADRRVDFRALVRDLAAKFRTRIELKQIGVRDEAKRLDGVGRCGRQYCSASWLPDLRPVNLGLAKDQKLSLNPTQISGACGRLMCCLRYEHDWYVETRRRFPKEGKIVTTAQGEERVVMNDLFRERVTLRRVSDAEMRIIPLEQLNRELRGEPVETDAATETHAEEWSEEILAMTDTVERPIPAMLRPPPPQARPERPVQLQRPQRPREQRPREQKPREQKPREQRDRDRRGGEQQRPQQQQAREQQPPGQQPREAAPSDPSAQPSEQGARGRSRRRRGRRGGRRGGGGADGGGSPGASPEAPSA